MDEFKVVNKTYVKTKNSVRDIYKHYAYALLAFIVLTIINYIVVGKISKILPLLISIGLSLMVAIVVSLIINLFKDKKEFIKIFTEDNIHIIALIIGLLGTGVDILWQTLAVIITVVIRKLCKNINLSSVVYGLLVIVLYEVFNNSLVLGSLTNVEYMALFEDKKEIIYYLLGIEGLSILLSVVAFIYLFIKKAIKYNVYISYVLTFIYIIGIYSLITSGNLLFFIYVLGFSNFLFLSVFVLPDYVVSPVVKEGQIIYGMFLGLLSAILIFVVPSVAIILPLLLGPIILTKILDNGSSKLKYNQKYYNRMVVGLTLLILIVSIILIVIF